MQFVDALFDPNQLAARKSEPPRSPSQSDDADKHAFARTLDRTDAQRPDHSRPEKPTRSDEARPPRKETAQPAERNAPSEARPAPETKDAEAATAARPDQEADRAASDSQNAKQASQDATSDDDAADIASLDETIATPQPGAAETETADPEGELLIPPSKESGLEAETPTGSGQADNEVAVQTEATAAENALDHAATEDDQSEGADSRYADAQAVADGDGQATDDHAEDAARTAQAEEPPTPQTDESPEAPQTASAAATDGSAPQTGAPSSEDVALQAPASLDGDEPAVVNAPAAEANGQTRVAATDNANTQQAAQTQPGGEARADARGDGRQSAQDQQGGREDGARRADAAQAGQAQTRGADTPQQDQTKPAVPTQTTPQAAQAAAPAAFTPEFQPTATPLSALPGGDVLAPAGSPQAAASTAVDKVNMLMSPRAVSKEIAQIIARRAGEGARRFDIRLDPPELGRIDVRLEFARDGQARAQLAFDRPETMEFLQKDSRALERALQDTGFDLDKDNLNFSLRRDERHAGGFLDEKDEHGSGAAEDGDSGAETASDAEPHLIAPSVSLRYGVDISI